MKFQTYRPKIQFEKNGIELLAMTLHILLIISGGFLLAYWAWILFIPATAELPPKLEQTTSSQLTTVLAAHWFKPASGQIIIPMATVNFKLVGIYASKSSHNSFAVFKFDDGKQRSVLLNEVINPGIFLQSITPAFVEVGQQGSTQKLYLEDRKSATSSTQTRTPIFKNLQ